MAERRMFAKTIIDSDAFLDMPLSTQSLYFHLSMRADDDGFVNKPKRIQRMIGASEDDLKLLIVKRFLIPFESGIVVIKHWKIHNYIQNDRYKETAYLEEKSRLTVKKNKAYSANVSTMDTEWIQDGYSLDTQVRLGKNSIVKVIDNNSSSTADAVEGECENTFTSTVTSKPTSKYSSDFEEFWSRYPRHQDKGNAFKKYKARLKEGYTVDQLINAATNYTAECQRERRESKYIKMGSTFLADTHPFEDYIEGVPASEGYSQDKGSFDFLKQMYEDAIAEEGARADE